MGALPPIFIEFLGHRTGLTATTNGVKADLASVEAVGGSSLAKLGAVSKAAFLGIGVAAGIAAVHTVHMAADFETAMTRVRTGAGESAENMGLVSRGVLQMAGEVGKSTEELTSSLYTVESAGYHGAGALDVLRVAAKGAKVGAAELPPVADALTTALNAYKLSASDATTVMNALVATEAHGKTNMEALAGSMSAILPVASAAKVGMNEVLGAMATMTAQGTSADVAATYLRQTIGQLSNPTGKAAQEMRGLGLDSVKVSQNLGKNGLASTLTMLTDAIQAKMGPAGTVLIETLKKASSNTSEFDKALANLQPAEQTQIGALATMVGGTKSMMAALQLTGPHMEDFKRNTKEIADQAKRGGNEVEGWKEVQGTFNQKMAEAKGALEAVGISIGQALLPAATKMADFFIDSVGWLTKHKIAVEVLAAAIGGVLVIGLAAATVAAWNFAIAILANPLTWIVVGIMLLIAEIVLLAVYWRDIWKVIKEVTKDVLDWLVGAWHWLADETSKAWRTYIVNPIREAWREIARVAVAGYHMVVDPVVLAWRWIASVTASVWHGISGFFAKWWPLLLFIFATPIAVLMSIWAHTHKWIADTASAIWGGIKGYLSDTWRWISGVASDAWSLVAKYIIDPTKAMWRELQSLWQTAMQWLSAVWADIGSKGSSAWGLIRDYIIRPAQQVWDSVTGIFGRISNFIGDAFDNTMTVASHYARQFASVGEDIVRGIMHGLDTAWNWLTDKVSNLAGDALDAAKSALGINSPSRVFADTVGRAIPEGIALGIDRHADKAHGAVTRLANSTRGAFGSVGGLEPAFAGGGSVGTRHGAPVQNVHVHVTVQGSVTADRDLASTIQRVMAQNGARNSSTYPSYRR